MLLLIVDLFPQAAGSPSVAPPPRALFEDFICSFHFASTAYFPKLVPEGACCICGC